ncbi:MAG: GDYXXLXY domain-containing protein [Mariprofundaceae bacterium]|nr:GDYXXLXY domain-containing protein [Mariprofundaceae bacterium]
MKYQKRIIIISMLLTLVLVGMVAKKQYTLNTGALVVLKTTPVDPRSLFRGDYVVLNYDISRLNVRKFALIKEFKRNDVIFLALQKNDKFWSPIAVFKTMPEHKEERVIIKGRVTSRSNNSQISIKYGIESYFVPEGEGRDLESLRNKGHVAMQIAVDTFGNAGVKAVLLDGKPLYIESLF